MNHCQTKVDNSGLIDGKYTLSELLDRDHLNKIFEHFSVATGFTTGLLEHPSQKLIIGTGWRDICTKFHRTCEESAQYCIESNRELTEKLTNVKELNLRHCGHGLVDGATPVLIRGVHYTGFNKWIFIRIRSSCH